MRLEGLPRYKESSTETPAFLNRFSPRRPYTLHPTCLESGLGPTASERAAARPSPCRPMMAEKLRLEVADRRLHEGLTIDSIDLGEGWADCCCVQVYFHLSSLAVAKHSLFRGFEVQGFCYESVCSRLPAVSDLPLGDPGAGCQV